MHKSDFNVYFRIGVDINFWYLDWDRFDSLLAEE